jgi:hypothetical protein
LEATKTRSQDTPIEIDDQRILLDDPHFVRQVLGRFFQQFLDSEISHFLQAEPYERTSGRKWPKRSVRSQSMTP